MTRVKTAYYAFEIDWIQPITIIVKEADPILARSSVVNLIHTQYGAIARVKTPAKKLRTLPKEAFPIKNAVYNGEQWAWDIV